MFAQFKTLEAIRVTKAAKFVSRYSQIGFRADGTKRVELHGPDKSMLRQEVFERDHWLCVDRRKSHCAGPLELSHEPPMSKSEGSDTLAGTKTRCRKHHRLLDGHGQPMHF